MSTSELISKVHELRELRRMAAEIEAEITALQETIKRHMEATGAEELSGIDWRITYKTVKATRFDKARMVQTFGQDCYNNFCTVTESKRFVLS